jgi:hypothetical protein
MSNAFAQFSEPMAWVLRGLIEYGWVDITRSRIVPPGYLGGFNLSFLPESQGKEGIQLHVPAVAGNVRCHEDETYIFELLLIKLEGGSGFAVRCADCNFLQEFAFTEANPLWCAGYIHQAVTEYVPEYVRWRVGGGELTWAQRQGVPPVQGEPCSASLATWIQQQLTLNRVFNESIWTAPTATITANTGKGPISPIAMVGNYGKTGVSSPAESARIMVNGPAKALSVMVYLGALASVFSLVNILVTIAIFQLDRMFALTTNILFVLLAGGGAAAAWFGVREYKQVKGKILPWFAIVYSALVPVCCFAGLPVAVWAAMRWNSPEVKAVRKTNT